MPTRMLTSLVLYPWLASLYLTADFSLSDYYLLFATMKLSYSKLIAATTTPGLKILDGSVASRWETPIGRLIDRSPDWTSRGDASLVAGGGYSDDLRFHWHLPWPKEVLARNVNAERAERCESKDMVTINDLEFAVIILSLAAATVAALTFEDDFGVPLPSGGYPILLNEADSMTALARARDPATRGSVVCSALMRIYAAVSSCLHVLRLCSSAEARLGYRACS